MRCVPITTTTKDTAIAYQLQRVITVCRNQIAPLLDKLLNRDGTIPAGKTVPLIREELRQVYFDSFTRAEPASPRSSKDEEAKQERLDRVARAREGKLDEFHSMDLYVYLNSSKDPQRFEAVPPVLSQKCRRNPEVRVQGSRIQP